MQTLCYSHRHSFMFSVQTCYFLNHHQKIIGKYLNKNIQKNFVIILNKNFLKLVNKNLNRKFYKKLAIIILKFFIKTLITFLIKILIVMELLYLYICTLIHFFLPSLTIVNYLFENNFIKCSYFKNLISKIYHSKIYALKTLFSTIYLSKIYLLKFQLILYINYWLNTLHKNINISFKNHVENSHISTTTIQKLNATDPYIFYSLRNMKANISHIYYKYIKFHFWSLNRYSFITNFMITHSIILIPMSNLITENFLAKIRILNIKIMHFVFPIIIVSILSILKSSLVNIVTKTVTEVVHIFLVSPITLLFQFYKVMLNYYHG